MPRQGFVLFKKAAAPKVSAQKIGMSLPASESPCATHPASPWKK
jgi:hypothetical protein